MEAFTRQMLREVSLVWEDLENGIRPALPSPQQEFLDTVKQNVEDRIRTYLTALLGKAVDYERPKIKKDLDCFQHLFDRFVRRSDACVEWSRIRELPARAVWEYASLEAASGDALTQLLRKLVVVKLNGGLGTSMGCKGPKSAIRVKGDLTFLDLTVQQIEHLNRKYDVDVPLVLMNSFNTDDDTEKILRKYRGRQVNIHTFEQSCYPRIHKDTLLPIAKDMNIQENLEAWYPPGHGDFYENFKHSGLLDQFLQQGLEYCFVSNIDNLGATVDLKILNVLVNSPAGSRPEFLMELTDKTSADVKGGTLVEYEDTLRLLEVAQVPKERVNEFKNVNTFKYFNTNNLWMKLDAIERVVSDGSLNMELIVNPKRVGDVAVVQLETAVGSAMPCFQRAVGVRVPRSRFLPVKKTCDLLLVMSDLYDVKHGALVMSEHRVFPSTPYIALGAHFSKNQDMMSRFSSIPGLLHLDHLTVSGDVRFGQGVTLKGTVVIVAAAGDYIDIPSGSELENKVITGNLRILDH